MVFGEWRLVNGGGEKERKMKKTFAIVMALSIMMAHGRSDVGGDVVTPGGVRIESQRVYVTSKGEGGADKSQWMDSALSFSQATDCIFKNTLYSPLHRNSRAQKR